MSEQVRVLDHGYVRLVETWGSDERLIEAARMSTAKGFEGWGPFNCPECGHLPASDRINLQGTPLGKNGCKKCRGRGYVDGDEKLLAFLWNNNHATPFEMGGLIVEVQAPIFVFREWHRHRTQSYNEMSARYVPLPDVCYLPDANDAVARSEAASSKDKQAGLVEDAELLTLDAALSLLAEEADLLVMVEDLYQRKLKAGFTKELARTHLTVSRYSRMRASANLRNWLGFLTLRADPKAQQEIRQYAFAVAKLIEQAFPRTHGLWNAGRK